MFTSTRSPATLTAAAAAVLATQVGLATSAEAKCNNGMCLVLHTSSDPASVNVGFTTTSQKVVQFDLMIGGQKMSIPANPVGSGFKSPSIQLPRAGEKISVRPCFGTVAPSTHCEGWANFTLPGPWIAVATGGGHYGSSMGQMTQTDATNRALFACPGSDCRTVTAAIGTCFSYARSEANLTIGAASIGNSVNQVEAAALKSCSTLADGACTIRRTKCK